jgi:hypothetical protein
MLKRGLTTGSLALSLTLGASCGDPVLACTDATHCAAQAGDLLEVTLNELHPTQPVLGYDEVYYKLGRYRSGKDVAGGGVNKRFSDWCEASGLVEATAATAAATLSDPTTFTCRLAPGAETADSKALMKTAVVGPGGQLYLTDGHHTFTSFWERADGGPNMRVRVRITGNLSDLGTEAFWKKMEENKWVWLFDGDNQPVTRDAIPAHLGLANFRNDLYRSLVYFTRDVAYSQAVGAPEFLEYYWGLYLRPRITLTAADMTDLTTYLAKVKQASQAMSALAPTDVVANGKTAADLAQITPWNAGKAETSGEFAKVSKPFSDAKPGKVAYALDYKAAP